MYLRIPKNLHLELSNNCNAKCPMCSRTQDPIDSIQELPIDLIQNRFANYRFNQINYCGNDGDPLIYKKFIEIVEFFEGTKQLIHTNGSLRSIEFWQQLAQIKNTEVVFAIDGSTKETHEQYRIGTQFEIILKNAEMFNSCGGTSIWQFIVFQHNQHQIESAKNISREMGFSKFETLYSRRDPSDNIIPIQKDATVSSGLECKSKQREEIYVRSDGEVFPCPYQGHRKNFSGLNLHTQTLQEIIFNEYFDKFSFDNPICDFNCNKKIRNQRIREVITTDRD